jgi:hypothetical protein
MDNQCAGRELAPGATCRIGAALVAESEGPKQASFSVTAGTGPITLELRGSAFLEADKLELAPTEARFPTTGLRPSAPVTFTVRNVGTIPVDFRRFVLIDKEFAISENRCSGSLAPGATCQIDVVFSPTVYGSISSRLVVIGSHAGVVFAELGGSSAP